MADYSSANVSPVVGFVCGVAGVSPNGASARFTGCGDILDVPYTGGNLASTCIAGSKMSPEQRKYEQYAKKSKRLKAFEAASPAHITYFNPDICWEGDS
jgi:hypothetical protein